MPDKDEFSKENYSRYLEQQYKLFEFSKQHIHKVYPKAHIHILTNQKHWKDNNYITHHVEDFPPTHTIKFKLYGLLKEPAMYLDTDIVINRKWAAHQLPTDTPFNCYSYSFDSNFDLQSRSPIPLPCKVNKLLNAGMIWIPKPDKTIVEELTELHKKYFDFKDWLLTRKMICNDDERALSLYVCIHNMRMKIMPEVNMRRGDGPLDKMAQSIHYCTKRAKDLMVKEVPFFQNV
jgi:hypothetical protein